MKTKIIKHELIAKNFNEEKNKYINQIDENEIDYFILQSNNSRLKTITIDNNKILLTFDFIKRLLQKINICNIFMKFRLNKFF